MAFHFLRNKDPLRGFSISDHVGDIVATSAAAVTGAAASSTVAATAGATTVPVLTSVGSFFGATLVVTTPVGWIIGTGAAAAVVGYGISRAVKRKGKNIGRREKEADIKDARIIKEQETQRSAEITNQDEIQIKKLISQLPSNVDSRHTDSVLDSFLSGKRSKEDTITMIKGLGGHPSEAKGFVEAVTDEVLLHSTILFSKSMVFVDGKEDLVEVDTLVQRLSEGFSVPVGSIYRLYGEAPKVEISKAQVDELREKTSPEFMEYLHFVLTEIAKADGYVAAVEKELLCMVAQPN